MTKTKKITALTIAAFAFLTSSVFAKEKMIKLQLVQKVTVNCPCDVEFLKKTFEETSVGNYISDSQTQRTTTGLMGANNEYVYRRDADNGAFSIRTIYVKVDPDSKEPVTFDLPTKYYCILDNKAVIELPGFASCSYSDDMEFVYVGSWSFNIDPYSFAFTNIDYQDEFDEAKEWLKKNSGEKKSEKLINGNLLISLDK